MTNDGWSKEWPSVTWPKASQELKDAATIIVNEVLQPIRVRYTKQGSNLVDDQAYLYFQCEKCQALFDPKTRSFATLNQKRFDAGWKCIWNLDGMGYKVYCKECGEK